MGSQLSRFQSHPPDCRFFGEHFGPHYLTTVRLQRTPLQCQLVSSTESRSCLSRCALSGRVLLRNLFQRTSLLAIDTIRGYRSALSSTLYNVVDLTNSVFLRNPLKNMDLQCPRYNELCPTISRWYRPRLATRRVLVQLHRHPAASTSVHLFSSVLVGCGVGACPSLYLYLYK